METFKRVQRDHKLDLKMLQDVKTRWNSTCLMLMRALRLQKAIQQWFDQEKETVAVQKLILEEHEWGQIRYIIQLTKPFALLGYLVGATSGPTIHMVFTVYNKLFSHLDEEKTRLNRKKKAWKRNLLPAVEAARVKLSTYYSRTDGDNGLLYNLGTVLNPAKKLQSYEGKEWEPEWQANYRQQFEDCYCKNYVSTLLAEVVQKEPSEVVSLTSLASAPRQKKTKTTVAGSEGARYLNEGQFLAIVLAIVLAIMLILYDRDN